MSRFVEQAIERAGLGAIFDIRKTGDLAQIAGVLDAAGPVDILILGALADALRATEADDVVHIHPDAAPAVLWVAKGESELDLLFAVARARITGPRHARIGVDWGATGMELAQVALGFGATDLTGPITRKNGALISEDDLKKVKGQGMVHATALKRKEIAALLRNAGRECVFTDEPSIPARAHDTEAVTNV